MKKRAAGIIAGLLLIGSFPAWADPYGGPGRHFRPPPPMHRLPHPHRDHGGPLVWGIAGLALGTALYSMSSPPPVVVAPQPIRPPPRMWYFCESYRAYYPNVQYCPEGWRAIPAY